MEVTHLFREVDLLLFHQQVVVVVPTMVQDLEEIVVVLAVAVVVEVAIVYTVVETLGHILQVKVMRGQQVE
jgi:hypothetical protein